MTPHRRRRSKVTAQGTQKNSLPAMNGRLNGIPDIRGVLSERAVTAQPAGLGSGGGGPTGHCPEESRGFGEGFGE